ncbi:MAG: hypothetical protein ACI4HQ_05840 [Acetatifactor sp.]
MIGFVFVGIVGILIYLKYRKWSFKKKFGFQMVLVNLMLPVTAFMVFAAVFSVREAAENVRDNALSTRLEQTQFYENHTGEYYRCGNYLMLEQDYEQEFEYLWERLCMYETSHRYRVFSKAVEQLDREENADERQKLESMAERYGEQLRAFCKVPVYAQNLPYADYYLEQALEGQEGGDGHDF